MWQFCYCLSLYWRIIAKSELKFIILQCIYGQLSEIKNKIVKQIYAIIAHFLNISHKWHELNKINNCFPEKRKLIAFQLCFVFLGNLLRKCQIRLTLFDKWFGRYQGTK